MKKTVVMLFDMDGVMINPKGYRHAFYETVNYFLCQIGLTNPINLNGVPELFEANGITCEWDMVPLTLLITLDNILGISHYDYAAYDGVDNFHVPKFSNIPEKLEINFSQKIRTIADSLPRRDAPADEILALHSLGKTSHIFPNLAEFKIVSAFLSNTRSFVISKTSMIFENYAIGGKNFRKIFMHEPVVDCPSYLEIYDEVLLDNKWLAFLRKAQNKPNFFFSFMTARPTLPPVEISPSLTGYLPEGEAAKSLLGLDIPLIGFGKLQYFANQLKINPDQLVKPSPFQALAAIMAAIQRNELTSLETAYDFLFPERNTNQGMKLECSLPDEFDLHIFEDSFVGIKACTQAVSLLQAAGYKISFYRWGISRDKEKRENLAKNGATVFCGINQAFSSILGMGLKFKRTRGCPQHLHPSSKNPRHPD